MATRAALRAVRLVATSPPKPAMRIALLSDIHGNFHALEACLDAVRARGVDRYVFLGDLVGYGADSARVVDVVMDAVARGGLAVRGNHDEAIDGEASYLNEMARAGVAHARHALSVPQRTFLRNLPLVERDKDCCFVHGSADRPERYPYLDSADAARKCALAAERPVAFCGHVHEQRLYFGTRDQKMSLLVPTPGIPIPVPHHRKWVALVGSVGQPRDRNPAAAFAIYDGARPSLVFHRVSYDHRAAAQRIRDAGLPEALAYRVERGV